MMKDIKLTVNGQDATLKTECTTNFEDAETMSNFSGQTNFDDIDDIGEKVTTGIDNLQGIYKDCADKVEEGIFMMEDIQKDLARTMRRVAALDDMANAWNYECIM